MAPRFLERHKKKGLLAALLLFLRRRQALSLLLLVVLLASTLIAVPSNFLIGLPGGSHLAAGVAWLAQKAGVDTSGWGLGGKSSFRELMEAFRAAKAGGSTRPGAPEDDEPSSLDMVKGSRKDLESPVAGVRGVLTPAETRAGRDTDGVAISEDELTGRRQGFLSGAMKGLFGFGTGNAELSGGAFLSKGFFREGSAGAGSRPNERAQAGMDSVGKVAVPKVRSAGGVAGRLLATRARAASARAIAGGRAASSLGSHLALIQLAEGKGRATLATEECVEPACPREFAVAQTGAIYDGNKLSDRGLLSGPADTPLSVPTDDPGGAGDASQLAECATLAQQCQKDKVGPMKRMGELQTQLNGLYSQMAGACGDRCKCGGCNSLKSQILGICGGELQTVITKVTKPCDLPPYCEASGITDPSTAAAGPSRDMCNIQMAKCKGYPWYGAPCCWFKIKACK